MIWLAWRQHRRQALSTLAALAALAAVMVPTGLRMHHLVVHNGLADCVRKLGDARMVPANSDTCNAAFSQFNNQFDALGTVAVLFVFLPLLVGLFWGAPLIARELEHGTHRLVWTQGVSRRQWALAKFGLIGLAVLAASALYAGGMTWWLQPLSQAGRGRFQFLSFDLQGVAPIGYTLFAVALGVFAGTVWQKMLPAMAVTLVGYLGARIAVAILARPRYLPPRTLTYPVDSGALQPNPYTGDWVQSMGIRDATGKLVMANSQAICSGGGRCAGLDAGSYNWQLYQPAGRFWLFQGIETAIFVALAALLIALAVRRIRRIA
jgi:hypothetical protein